MAEHICNTLLNTPTTASAAPAFDLVLASSHKAALNDPLFNTLEAYHAGKQAFEALPDGAFNSEQTGNELLAKSYGLAQEALMRSGQDTPKTTSLRGVSAAIRHALMEGELIDVTAENALRSALAYLEEQF